MRVSGSVIIAAACTLPLGLAGSASAQTAEPVEEQARLPAGAKAPTSRNMLTVGAGVALVPSYEGSNDYVLIPAGALRGTLAGRSFFSRGTSLYVDLIRDTGSVDIQLGPVIALDFNRVGRLVDDRIEALGRRRIAFEAGGFVGLSKTGLLTSEFDTLGVTVSARRDVSGIHGSYIVEPTISYGTPLSRRTYVGLGASATIVGEGYARSYFTVDPAGAARSGLPVFANPRGGFKDFTLSVLGNYALSGDLQHGLGVFVLGSYARLQGDFARSPVTRVAGRPEQLFGAIGIGYTF